MYAICGKSTVHNAEIHVVEGNYLLHGPKYELFDTLYVMVLASKVRMDIEAVRMNGSNPTTGPKWQYKVWGGESWVEQEEIDNASLVDGSVVRS